MSEGIYITKTDFNVMMKKVNFIEQYIINQSKPTILRKWITEQEAMQLIGCKESKLQKLRLAKTLEYKYASKDKNGNGKGILISKDSVEAYNQANTQEGIYKSPLKKVKE